MLRILRAFAWMRWRTFLNSFQSTRSRDVMQRLSIAVEGLAPLVVMILMIPSAIVLAAGAGYTGFLLTSGGDASPLIRGMRALLAIATVLAILGPIMMPGAGRVNAVRLLLLPIPARTLYVAQAASALADPWILLLLPIVIGLPIGLAIGGSITAGAVAALAAIAIIGTMVGISALVTTLIHLLLRDRRRGELVGLVLILLLPAIGFLPMIMRGMKRESQRLPPWVAVAATSASAMVPSELYSNAITNTVSIGARASIAPLTTLLVTGAILHGIGLILFRRVLDSPTTTGSRRVASKAAVRDRALPGVAPGTSAVALAFWRLALRTTRGRSILIAPLFLFLFFGFMQLRSGALDFGPFKAATGLGLAALVSGIGLLSILSLAMNQFAVDRAGLTLTLLSPLSTRQILVGKAIGGALIVMPSTLVCILLAAVVFPGGSPALWLALPLALVASYVLGTPAAAVLSALFPRLVDLNSIGSKSNAHGVAGFAGMLAFAVAAAPPAGLMLLAAGILDRPWLAPVFVLLWCLVAFWLARLLFIPVEKVFDNRRENLARLV